MSNCSIDLDKLPLGVPSFGTIRKAGMIYVDKTSSMIRLIEGSRYTFLSRPRRFGKSLLIDTLATLFSRGASAFEGLEAAKIWHDGTYPVIRLDFSFLKAQPNMESFSAAFDADLREALIAAGFRTGGFAACAPMDPVRRWKQFLQSADDGTLVVLIDEYDAPLTSRLHQPDFFDSIREMLGGFFDVTKGYSGKLRYLFITGVMKFSQASLFSTFNNITDASLDPQFGELLGYTEDEIISNFSDYLLHAANMLEMSAQDVLKAMQLTYDGFCFDELASTHVYAPWSVLSFLKSPKRGLRHYWFESAGTPSILVNYLKSHRLLDPADFDADPEVSLSLLSSSESLEDLDERALLAHAGYLTIKEVHGDDVRLGYPNAEVRDAMATLYARAFWPQLTERRSMACRLVAALQRANESEILSTLNAIVHHLDYQDFSLGNEAAIRQIVQVFCLGANLDARIEVHSPRGRSDLEIAFRNLNIVFEFKFVKQAASAGRAIEMAVRQMKERDYGFILPGCTLLRIALAFAADERKFAAISVEKLPSR